MTRKLIAAALLLCALAAAQETPAGSLTPEQVATMSRLRDAALASDYAYRQVAHLTNNIGPRLTGSTQAQAAVEYVAGELRRLGLEVQLEKVMVPHWVRGAETGELVQYAGQAAGTVQKIVLTALGSSVATPPEGITADIVVVRNYEELKALGRDKVAGKIVLFNVPWDKQLAAENYGLTSYGEVVQYRGGGPSEAAKLGAAAVLVRSAGGADFRLPHTGLTSYAANVAKIPAAAVASEDAELIASLAQQGPVKMKLILTPQTLPDVVSYNVIGDLKGSEHPEQVVIVSGHLDSWDLGTGAIDDGAGVTVAMQVANLFRQLGIRPRRTLRVVAWMDEEGGILGAQQYVKDFPMNNQFAAVESDLGAGHPVGIHAGVVPAAMPLLQPISLVLQEIGAPILEQTEGAGSDIGESMATLGVPTFDPIQDTRYYFNWHHTAADTLDKIVPRELAENAAIMAVLGYALTEIPELPRKPASTRPGQ